MLAGVPLLGLLPAQRRCSTAAATTRIEAVAAGELRAGVRCRRARPATSTTAGPSTRARGKRRARRAARDGRRRRRDARPATVAWVPDAPGADLLVVVGVDEDGAPVAVAVEARGRAASRRVTRYDATRSLGHVTLDGARGHGASTSTEDAARAGVVPRAGAARRRVASARSRRRSRWRVAVREGALHVRPRDRLLPGGQARRSPRSCAAWRTRARCCYYAGWAFDDQPEEFALAASAARSAAGAALDFAARQNIATHGGIGATWEHDAPLFFRRAQLSRRLLGGTARRDRPRRRRAARGGADAELRGGLDLVRWPSPASTPAHPRRGRQPASSAARREHNADTLLVHLSDEDGAAAGPCSRSIAQRGAGPSPASARARPPRARLRLSPA